MGEIKMNAKPFYKTHGLLFWNEKEILARNQLIERISISIKESLLFVNKRFFMKRCEAPLLMPKSFLSCEYDSDKVFLQSDSDLVLRPETTPGSYVYAKELMLKGSKMAPMCIWQAGKSFRKEQNKPYSRMSLTEFYQLEFQCIYSKDSKCDYYNFLLENAYSEIRNILKHCVVVKELSDRLPSYSKITTDINVKNKDSEDKYFMEVASISLRNDFDENHDVVEIAIGIDRLLYFL